MYGPVRTVVWEEGSRKTSPYPDFLFFIEKSGGELAHLSLSLVVPYCNSSDTTISLLKVSLELVPP